MATIERFLNELSAVLPEERIYTDELRTLAWGTDASFYRLTPQVVIRAKDESEVSMIVKAASKHGLPFTFRAAGTSLSGQSVSDSILIVAGKHWEDYSVAPDGESITLQPGIVGARVNQILKPLRRVFPPDPASIGSAMVGGIVANNASGMNCGTHANSDRMLLSARLVLPDGTVLDTGNEASREAFRHSHPDFIAKIESLRDRIRANESLAARIRKKYSIKPVPTQQEQAANRQRLSVNRKSAPTIFPSDRIIYRNLFCKKTFCGIFFPWICTDESFLPVASY